MVIQPLFTAGETCADVYRILQLQSRSLITESYLALHTKTRTPVLLTCSRFEHMRERPQSSAFLALAATLRELALENIPRVLDSGIDEDSRSPDPIYWVARERFDDTITVAGFLGDAPVSAGTLANARALMQAEPLAYRTTFALLIGCKVADALDEAAAHGVFHGGLDPRTTIAFRGDASPTLLEIGYGDLFGPDHFIPPPGDLDFRAPEQRAGNKPDLRSDLYALGAIMHWMIIGRCPDVERPHAFIDQLDPAKAGPSMPTIFEIVARAIERNPKDRFQDWASMYDALSVLTNVAIARGNAPSKVNDAVAAPAPGAIPEAPASGTQPLHAADDAAPTPRIPQAPVGNMAADAGTKRDTVAPRANAAPRVEASSPADRAARPSPTPRVRRALWAMLGAAAALLGAAALKSPIDRALYAVPTLRAVRPMIVIESEPERDQHAPPVSPPAPLTKREVERPRARSSRPRSTWGGSCSDWASCPSVKPRQRDKNTYAVVAN